MERDRDREREGERSLGHHRLIIDLKTYSFKIKHLYNPLQTTFSYNLCNTGIHSTTLKIRLSGRLKGQAGLFACPIFFFFFFCQKQHSASHSFTLQRSVSFSFSLSFWLCKCNESKPRHFILRGIDRAVKEERCIAPALTETRCYK